MATGARNIKYTIAVDEKGAIKSIDVFEKKVGTSTKQAASSFSDFSTKAVKALTAVYASYKTVEKAIETTKIGSALLIQEKAFNKLATSMGINSNDLIKNLKNISNQTITTAKLMKSAGTAMLLGIPADKLDDLMRIARASMKITGQTAEEAFGDIAVAVGRQSKMILDNLGIILNLETAYENYAVTIGKAVDKLTDADKKMAFMNETIRKGEIFIKNIGETTGNEFEEINKFITKFKESMDDLYTLIATNLNPIIKLLNDHFDELKIILGAIIAIPIIRYVTILTGGLIELSATVVTLTGVSGFGGMIRQLPIIARSVEVAGTAGGRFAGALVRLIALFTSLFGWVTLVVGTITALYFLFKQRETTIDKFNESLGITKDEFYGVSDAAGKAKKAIEDYNYTQLKAAIANQKRLIARGSIGDDTDPFGNASEAVLNRRKQYLKDLERTQNLYLSKQELAGWDAFTGYDEPKKTTPGGSGDTKKTPLQLAEEEADKYQLNLAPNVSQVDYMDQIIAKAQETRSILDDLTEKGVITEKEAAEESLRNYIEMSNKMIEKEKEAQKQLSEFDKQLIQIGEHAADSFAWGLTDALFEFAEGTKTAEEAFKQFAASFLKQVAQMIMQALILKAIKSVMGGFSDGGIVPGGTSDYAGAGTHGVNPGDVNWHARGGIVSKPTVFPMANGDVGVMGEAGAEAIMPLKRGKDGNLGVAASVGKDRVTMSIVNNINIENGDKLAQDPNEMQKFLNTLNSHIDNRYKENVRGDMRVGGAFNRASMGGFA